MISHWVFVALVLRSLLAQWVIVASGREPQKRTLGFRGVRSGTLKSHDFFEIGLTWLAGVRHREVIGLSWSPVLPPCTVIGFSWLAGSVAKRPFRFRKYVRVLMGG
jgi:hypothetical protein